MSELNNGQPNNDKIVKVKNTSSDAFSFLDDFQSNLLKKTLPSANQILNPKNSDKFTFDRLKMYFGEPFEYKGLKINMPTIGDIIEIGESNFYKAMSPFICNSTSIRVDLWHLGIDWNFTPDIEVFSYLIRTVEDKSPLKLLFGDINFEDFILINIPCEEQVLVDDPEDENNKKYETKVVQKLALVNESNKMLLFEDDYMVIAEYIREILNSHPKVEKTKSKTAKEWIIQEDEMKRKFDEYKNKDKIENPSTLLSLVSTLVNHPGFKYKTSELKELGLYQFMDSVKRIQKYENASAALKGCYSGMIDGSKMDKKILDFFSDD